MYHRSALVYLLQELLAQERPAGFISGHVLVVDGAQWMWRKPLLPRAQVPPPPPGRQQACALQSCLYPIYKRYILDTYCISFRTHQVPEPGDSPRGYGSPGAMSSSESDWSMQRLSQLRFQSPVSNAEFLPSASMLLQVIQIPPLDLHHYVSVL